jgi:hypothetical protein
METKRLTLLSRTYCHLCHDMEVALVPLLAEFSPEFSVLDVDADPLLEARYDELVPVLLAGEIGENEVLCHYHLNDKVVRAYLAQ